MNLDLSNLTELEKAIVRAIVFFDLFNRAPNLEEIRRSASVSASLGDYFRALEKLISAKILSGQKDAYCLSGREELFSVEVEFHELEIKKALKARRGINVLRFIPGIEFVALANNFSYKLESDIDLFIITKAKYLWWVRLLLTFKAQVLGLRRHGHKIKDRLCLSFLISTEAEDLSPLMLENDPYFKYWFVSLEPLFIKDEIDQEFIVANNCLRSLTPNFIGFNSPRLLKNNYGFKISRLIIDFIYLKILGRPGEFLAKKIQSAKMKRNYDSLVKVNDKRVVINDQVLKFHENDRRVEIRDKFYQKLKILNL